MNLDKNKPVDANGNSLRSRFFKRKIYETAAEKKRDFWIGVGLFFGVNILLLILSTLCSWGVFACSISSVNAVEGVINTIINIGSPINIGLIVYFAFTRSQIALGMVAGYGIVQAISICFGVIFTVWCFVASYSGGY